MLNITRRNLFGAAAAATLPMPAIAQTGASWPNRPVRLVVPYAPGGPSDILARALQPALQESLGQPVIVENRPGAAAIIGTEAVARSDDGHTFLVADSPHTILPAVHNRLPFDPVADFKPVSIIGAVSMILMVKPAHAARSVEDFVAAAKARPEIVTFGSSGVGSLTHLLPEWLAMQTGTKFTVVPYRGSGPALLDVVAGQIDAIFSSTLSASGQLRDGLVRPLAVASQARVASLPDVPTFKERGIEMVSGNWWGILAPKASEGAIERLDAALNAALDGSAVKERFATLGIEARPRGAAPFRDLITAEIANWSRVAREAGVSVQ